MRDALRKLSGLGHFLRPVNITTPDQFNAHLDGFAAALETMKVESVVEVEGTEPEMRQETGGSDRMQHKGRTRKKSTPEDDSEEKAEE